MPAAPAEEELFQAARRLADPREREAFLRAACGEDAELRGRVEALLAAFEQTGNPLDGDFAAFGDRVAATALLPFAGEAVGQKVGPYTLLQKLGEGGMGAVWAAEQHAPVRRRVALKLVKPGMDSAQVVRRFEAERQALALMDHTNIAKVFDAGTTDSGRPYFAMELVKGVPVTKYCDDLNLPVRERLALFVPVCQALQHAHQKGVIHRDVKPSNVLVCIQDGKPVPKVIDFGVAKALHQKLADRTIYTEIGGVIGTLEYMAPEQAELSALDVDTRADVYALGALLYELLTGSTPLDKKRLASAGLAEVMRIIREEEPPKPSTRLSESKEAITGLAAHRRTEPSRLTREVRGDLDWIVMKCLEKDRARRYETANGLARDIERYLTDEPVEARPPSRGYRLRKLARRNKGTLAAGALVVLALVAGAGVATWQAVRATKAESLAQTRYEDEKVARKDAVAEKKAAEAERGRAVTQAARATAVADFLRRLLRSADPNETRGANFTVRQLLDEASGELAGRFAAEPEVEADVRAAIGAAYTHIDLWDLAEPHLRRALDLRRGAASRDEIAYAECLIDWGRNEALLARRAGAAAAAREALAIYRRRGGGPDRVLDALRLLEFCAIGTPEVDVVAAEATEFARTLPGGEHAELASILHFQATEWAVAGKGEAAEALARRALAMHRRTHPAGHPETAWGAWSLGVTLEKQGKLAEAEAAYREALDLFLTAFGPSRDGHGQTMAVAALTNVLNAQGKRDDIATLNRFLESLPDAEFGGSSRTPESAFRRAELYFSANRPHLAVAALDLAAELADDPHGPAISERLARAYARATVAFMDLSDRPAEGRVRATEIGYLERLVEHAPTEDHRAWLARSKAYQGLLHQKEGRFQEATAHFTAAVDMFAALDRDFPKTLHHRQECAFFSRQLAYVLGGLARFDEAVGSARHAIDLDDSLVAQVPNDLDHRKPGDATYRQRSVEDRAALLRVLLQAGRVQEAESEFRGFRGKLHSPSELNDIAWSAVRDRTASPEAARFAVTLAEAAVKDPEADGLTWNTLGVARYRAGNWPGAAEACSKSMELLGDRFFAHNGFFLAMARRRLGDDAAARDWYTRAAAWTDRHSPADKDLRALRAEAAELLGPANRPPVEALRPAGVRR